MKKVLIFAGTTEGRELAELLADSNINYGYIRAKTAKGIPSSVSIWIIWNATWHTRKA